MKGASFLLWSLTVLTLSCHQPDMKFRLTEVTPLDSIPGASGLGINEQYIMVIGDNSPHLYLLDHTAKPSGIINIYPTDDFKDGKIKKSLKPDFEALEMIKGETHDEVLIFGSGSRGPQRDVFIHVILAPEPIVKTFDLVAFYDHLREMDEMSGYELNIEAVALHENQLLLFNRGKNLIFSFDYLSFLGFINDGIPYPHPVVTEVVLPQLNGFVSGFSGATMIPGTSTLLFTTSVEDTPNAYDDGEILGSFIGMVDLSRSGQPIRYFLIEEDNQPYKVKIESIAILNQMSKNELEVLMVTDSDGDKSLLLKGILTW